MQLCDLWLPIVAAAGAVFVLSSIVWMALPYHKGDFQKLPGEAEYSALLKRSPLAVGRYVIGWCAPGEKPANPSDPKALLLVQPAGVGMGKAMLVWVLHLLLVSVLVGYLAHLAVPRGAEFLDVFRVASVAALLAYAGGALPRAIWEGVPWKLVPAALLDALIYAAGTGAIFGWLWPR